MTDFSAVVFSVLEVKLLCVKSCVKSYFRFLAYHIFYCYGGMANSSIIYSNSPESLEICSPDSLISLGVRDEEASCA